MRRVEKSKEEEAEVDELLRATEDHLLLNLHVDAHTTAASFDSDLARRFQALKSPAPASSSPDPRFPSSKPEDRRGGADADEESKRILGSNLAARFAALKGPISPAESGTGLQQSLPIPNNQDEDEVEKVMQWAMDAARLNPSKPHDNNDDDDDEEEDHSDEDDDEEVKEKKMGESSSSSSSSKGKGKPRRWFFF